MYLNSASHMGTGLNSASHMGMGLHKSYVYGHIRVCVFLLPPCVVRSSQLSLATLLPCLLRDPWVGMWIYMYLYVHVRTLYIHVHGIHSVAIECIITHVVYNCEYKSFQCHGAKWAPGSQFKLQLHVHVVEALGQTMVGHSWAFEQLQFLWWCFW